MQLFLESPEELELLRISVNKDLSAKEKVEAINKIVNNISDAKKTLLMYADLYKSIYIDDKIFYVKDNHIHEVDRITLEVKER